MCFGLIFLFFPPFDSDNNNEVSEKEMFALAGDRFDIRGVGSLAGDVCVGPAQGP